MITVLLIQFNILCRVLLADCEQVNTPADNSMLITLLVVAVVMAIIWMIIGTYFIVTRHDVKRKNRMLIKMIDELNQGKRRSLLTQNKDTREEYARLLSAVLDEKLYSYQQLDRDTFAQHMNISRHALNEILSTNTDGLSFPQWLNNIRLERACYMLRNEPDKSVNEIAAAVGLTPDNLRRLFNRQYGISPTDYRLDR